MQCPVCNASNPEGKKFCGDCGASLLPDQRSIRGLVEQEINSRFKEQKLVELETSHAIISRLMEWAKIFGYAIAIPLTLLGVLLGFLGIKTYSDFSKFSGLVETAKKDASDRIQRAQKENDELVAQQQKLRSQLADITKVSEELQVVTKRLDRLEKLAFEPSAALTPELQKNLQSSFDTFQLYLRALGYNSRTGRVSIYVDPKLKDNAFYSDGRIVIGRPFAEDSNVIFREYTHHALAEVVQGGLGAMSQQIYGLESGLADYFPCSFLNNPIFGAKAAQALRKLYGGDALPDGYIRNLANDLVFSQLSASNQAVAQQVGAVWGAAFWQIRGLLGRDSADKLFFDSWVSMQPAEIKGDDPSVFVQKLVQLDRASRGGRDITQIRSLLERRQLPLKKVPW